MANFNFCQIIGYPLFPHCKFLIFVIRTKNGKWRKMVNFNFCQIIGYPLFPHCKFLILVIRTKYTQNEPIIAHFEYFFTCHYSKTIWLAENLKEIKITHYEKNISHIKQKFPHFEKGLINVLTKKTFFVSLRLPLFSPRYIALKLN